MANVRSGFGQKGYWWCISNSFLRSKPLASKSPFWSRTVKYFFPPRLPKVGISKCSRLITLFKSFGSKRKRRLPSFLSTITRLLTQIVGSSVLAMILLCSIWSSFSFRRSCNPCGTRRGGCMTGSAPSCGTDQTWYNLCVLKVGRW